MWAGIDPLHDLEDLARARLRSLRRSQGLSLEELAERSHLSASTISRIETGKRSLGLDVLVALARALHVDLDALLGDAGEDGDVVIRPVPTSREGMTVWPLTRATSTTTAVKLHFEPTSSRSTPRVHPGHDWLFVLSGRISLTLGTRTIVVESGEAAEFSTMTPHAIDARDGPAEVIMVLNRDGEHAHLHTDDA